MKILLFIDSLVLGGAQKQLVSLALALNGCGDKVSICTYYPLQGALDSKNAQIIDVHCLEKKSRYDLSPVWKLGRYAKSTQPDVLVAFLSTPSIYAELSKLTRHGVPIVVSERNGPKLNRNWIVHKLQNRLHSLAEKVVFNNHAYRNEILRESPELKDNSCVIYNGVRQHFFSSAISDIASERNDKDCNAQKSPKPFRFCAVSARSTAEKGLFDLIEAADCLMQTTDRPFVIDWIGPDSDKLSPVKEAIDQLEKRRLNSIWNWAGVRQDMSDVYSQYDSLVVPSHREGLSNVLCEAMASGLPCVVSDVSDHLSVVGGSAAGYVFESQAPEELAKSMALILDASPSEYETLSANASRFAMENFSYSQFTEQWRSLLNSLVNE